MRALYTPAQAQHEHRLARDVHPRRRRPAFHTCATTSTNNERAGQRAKWEEDFRKEGKTSGATGASGSVVSRHSGPCRPFQTLRTETTRVRDRDPARPVLDSDH
jgi:hypothetical protein